MQRKSLWLMVSLCLCLGMVWFPFDTQAQKKRLIAHEWGTFTTHVDVNGVVQTWNPLNAPRDLPGFVRVYHPKNGIQGTVRMETPVIYFYTSKKMTVSVDVEFPHGQISEFYPDTSFRGHGIGWKNCLIDPTAEPNFLKEPEESHYYPARETDAVPVRVKKASTGEQLEKFLFYRGVGTFDLPLGVRLDGNQFVVKNNGTEPIAKVAVFENREGKAGFAIRDLATEELRIERPALETQSLEVFKTEIETLLVANGLYEKEAKAMIKTWNDVWTAEGLRVFYLIPRQTTDKILPLKITPAPAELVRVMVGRVEVQEGTKME
ncbi:MAG TPA: hypothetical protein PLL06_02085 [Acidobacteriota bacterium]|nr:hypothetical protein [Acidobacteriota bacterium]HNB71865.1 hypothetical protein [Acidobacteriota bacterium]HND20026.1 hypothetical protein [Acidobacteriota bacterium]HNG92397.1 hypothetical protein [Acidobacteriota bacterium]HNH83295.1 hypothetical protein [Acidobacteriota bacterium]